MEGCVREGWSMSEGWRGVCERVGALVRGGGVCV